MHQVFYQAFGKRMFVGFDEHSGAVRNDKFEQPLIFIPCGAPIARSVTDCSVYT